MTDLNKLTDWELLEYLRQEKKWCVIPFGTKEDIENEFEDIKFTDDEWTSFIRKVDKSQHVIEGHVIAMYHGILSCMDLECDLVESNN